MTQLSKHIQGGLFATNELLIMATPLVSSIVNPTTITNNSSKATNNPKAIELNCLGINDFIRQYNSLRFLNPNRIIELQGFIKSNSGHKINYHIKSKNLAISFINLECFQISTFAKPKFDSVVELNNYLSNLLENERKQLIDNK